MVAITYLTFAMSFKNQIGIRACSRHESRKPRFVRQRLKRKMKIKKKKRLNQKDQLLKMQ
jgi:hypothetical protein